HINLLVFHPDGVTGCADYTFHIGRPLFRIEDDHVTRLIIGEIIHEFVDHHFVPVLECRVHAQSIHRERYEQELSDYHYEDHRDHYHDEPFLYFLQHNATPLFIHFSVNVLLVPFRKEIDEHQSGN